MQSASESESPLRRLDADIATLIGKQTNYDRERTAIATKIAHLEKRSRYWQFVTWFRSPAAQFGLWPIGVLVCGPAVVAALFFVTSRLFTSSLFMSFVAGGCGVLAGVVAFAALLFRPPSEEVKRVITSIENELPSFCDKRDLLSRQYNDAGKRLRALRTNRLKLVSSIQYQREQFLRENWKAMRSVEWEEYLTRVCLALGYSVETTKTTGDQGVDLVVQRGRSRIAIQAKGYFNSVSNTAVQQAVAGMNIYKCNRCAVIINSKFTPSAIELAEANGCILISEDNFEDFVCGQVALFD